ncbi:MAG: hypothetical protein PHR94_04955 [Methylomonas lenta]|nr:hypothetical protein [Methylomonas lenta]
MTSLSPFQIENFEGYCNSLKRVDIDPGYVMYTNHHASNDRPAARAISAHQLEAAKAYLENPSDETFIRLVKLGALFDTEWDRRTVRWNIIAFEGWEVLHRAFAHLYAKSGHAMEELTGLSGLP